MTSCAYIYLYIQYKTRLITECTVHCPMAWECFLTMDNLLCWVLPIGYICYYRESSVTMYRSVFATVDPQSWM